MSLNQLLATIRAAWLRIVLMVVVATSIAFALAVQAPKQYTAKARVMLNIDNPDPTQYSALKRGMATAYIGSEMKLVTDEGTMREVVTKLGWPDNPQVLTEWQTQTGGVGDVTAWAAAALGRNVQVGQLEDSAILEIYYTAESVEAAKAIVALIRTAYIDESQRLRADAARRAAAWNRTQSAKALATLQAAEAARAEFVKANGIPLDAPGGGLDYMEQVAALNGATNHIVAERNAAAVNSTAEALNRKLNSLDAEIAVLKLRGEANPATVALEAERDTTAQQLAREKAVTLAGPGATDGQIGLVREQRDRDYLAARLRLLDRTPLYDRLAAFDRDIAMKALRYNAVSSHVVNFDQVAGAPAGLKVIGDVIASDEPTFPNVPLLTGVAAGASFALAIAFALLAELARRQVRDPEDLLFSTGAPVLAVIADRTPGRLATFARRIATLGGRWRSRRDSNPRYRLPSTAV